MASLRDEKVRNGQVERLQKLTPETKGKWGRLSAPGMVCHLIDGLKMALGDVEVASLNKKIYQSFPIKHLIIYVVPFPKNVPTAPELLATAPSDFEGDRRQLAELMERLAKGPAGKGPSHPFFGPLTNEEWNALQWKHVEHHLKQFGI